MPLPSFLAPSCYLGGMDWVVAALDRDCRMRQGADLCFQVCLDLASTPPPGEFAALLARFMADCPMLHGRPARAWNLAPYWRTPGGTLPPPRLARHDVASKTAAYAALETGLAQPFAGPEEHLRFTLVAHPEGCLLGFCFDHRLFDAKGGEAFLRALDEHGRGGPPLRDLLPPGAPSRLDRWGEKFRCGRQVNRAFRALAEPQPPQVLPSPPPGPGCRPRVHCVEFTAAQAEAVAARAGREAGYLMLMPFLLAFSIGTLHRIFMGRNMIPVDGHYRVSVTADTRGPERAAAEILFNHLSFFLFKATAAEADDASALLPAIKAQLYAQVKEDFPRALAEASDLMRIVPLPLLARLMRLHGHGEVASFCFSYLGASPYPGDTFLGIPLRNIVHQPVVPPPGLGLFFQPFRGRLNAILAHADGLITDAEAEAILDRLRSLPG